MCWEIVVLRDIEELTIDEIAGKLTSTRETSSDGSLTPSRLLGSAP